MLAIVKVFPEPVIPLSVWWVAPDSIPETSLAIASGWSPAGIYFECNIKRPFDISFLLVGCKTNIIKKLIHGLPVFRENQCFIDPQTKPPEFNV